MRVSALSEILVRDECATNLARQTDGTLVVWVENGKSSGDPDYANYEYRFSEDLLILQVRSTSQTDLLSIRGRRAGGC